MEEALAEARAAGDRGEVPVGAVLVGPAGEVLARAGNRTRELSDPTAHAEMMVIREAARRLGSERLTGCDLYVTLEPCADVRRRHRRRADRAVVLRRIGPEVGRRGAWGEGVFASSGAPRARGL